VQLSIAPARAGKFFLKWPAAAALN